jgi:Abortive infection alpha
MDPATTRAVAKAAEETAKAAGKVTDIVHDTGGYLRRVFADLPEDLVGLAGGDWLHEVRIRNRDRWRRRTEKILQERDRHEAIELSPNMAMALIAGAQDESREELMELWARLLANAMDPNLNSVRQSFIDAVKTMDPPDALVLKYIGKKKFSAVRSTHDPNIDAPNALRNVAYDIGLRQDEVELSILHLQSLLFFELSMVTDAWETTVTFREFMRACYPELGAVTER